MLVLIQQGNNFCGFIGMKTGVKVGEIELCVGDIVRVPASRYRAEWINIVGIFGSVLTVNGIGAPISELNIVEIVKSHKKLKKGDEFFSHGVFTVSELKK
ncbi:hypothetical protein [Calidifontibacillus erzurumensis]|uniref:hypothetical protein n=1 Tax=Calidifontibacillus erzurumensis TaxID=2741433 RepID=UPI0035B568CE